MAFQGGRRARKPETVQNQVENEDLPLCCCVGNYTHNIEKCCIDRLRAAVYLFLQKGKESNLTNEYTLDDNIKQIGREEIIQYINPLLQEKDYCFNHIIRKIFVAYPYPVNCGLELVDDEKKLLIDINNFKCSFMEETLGSLYLKTKIILGDEKEYPDDIKRIFQEEELSNNVNYKEIVGKTDRLGFYTKHSFSNSNVIEPEVWLLINKMGNVDIRKFTLAKVYIHEMMHRYYDMHPELLLKKYVKEIEEPMAEFATIIFCEEFFKNHDEYQELLDVAIGQTESLKNTNDFIYALGADLYNYHYLQSLINDYRHVCMMMDEQNILVSKYSEDVKNNESAFKHEDERAAKNLCDALMNCIKGHRK